MQVCSCCFNDSELKRFIESNSTEKGKCDYCGEEINTDLINVDELLDFFIEFLGLFEEDELGEPLLNLIKNDWNFFAEKVNAQQILQDILTTSGSNNLDPLKKVVYVDEIKVSTTFWEKLKEDLKWSRRFLTDIEELRDLGWDTYFIRLATFPLGEFLYRARIHKNDGEDVYSKDIMGCPDRLYANSGRANPQGIPYLYLSKEVETTFYETRALYLDEISIGHFRVKADESIVLVDFTEVISAFLNVGDINNYAKSLFLKQKISIDLSKPLRRYDSELEYIPTQFICEYIRYTSGADGIIFSSSLHIGGTNVVLFNEIKIECFEVTKYRVTDVKIESTPI